MPMFVQFELTRALQRMPEMLAESAADAAQLGRPQDRAFALQHLVVAVRPDHCHRFASRAVAHRERLMPMHVLDLPFRHLGADIDALEMLDALSGALNGQKAVMQTLLGDLNVE